MTGIRVRRGESIESALRRFEKVCKRDNIQEEIRRRRFYQKPSEKRSKRKR